MIELQKNKWKYLIVGFAVIVAAWTTTTSLSSAQVPGELSWLKNDNAGNPLGGATFQVCRTHDYIDGSFVKIDPAVCFTTEDNEGRDHDPAEGKFLVFLEFGKYTVKETIAPAGFALDPDTVKVSITPNKPSVAIAEPFVNNRPILKIIEFGYTNEPTGTPLNGVVNGTATYIAKVKNFGNAAARMNVSLTGGIQGGVLDSGSLVYVGSTGPAGVSQPAAGTSCVAGCTTTWNKISLAPGAEQTFSIAVEYNQLPDGTVVEGDLTGEYKTNIAGDTTTRTASGSPAIILFTVQAD